jgi:hypothetical protein
MNKETISKRQCQRSESGQLGQMAESLSSNYQTLHNPRYLVGAEFSAIAALSLIQEQRTGTSLQEIGPVFALPDV